MKEKFASALNMAIDGLGLNPSTYAVTVGLSPNAVLKWVNGKTFPKPDKWKLILDTTGLNPQHYVDYSTGKKGSITHQSQKSAQTVTQTAADNARQQAHTGAGNVAMFDSDNISCVGYDERNQPKGVDADDFAELLFWLKRYPAMIHNLLETARAYRFSKDG